LQWKIFMRVSDQGRMVSFPRCSQRMKTLKLAWERHY
jgi:hypothetical protein